MHLSRRSMEYPMLHHDRVRAHRCGDLRPMTPDPVEGPGNLGRADPLPLELIDGEPPSCHQRIQTTGELHVALRGAAQWSRLGRAVPLLTGESEEERVESDEAVRHQRYRHVAGVGCPPAQ